MNKTIFNPMKSQFPEDTKVHALCRVDRMYDVSLYMPIESVKDLYLESTIYIVTVHGIAINIQSGAMSKVRKNIMQQLRAVFSEYAVSIQYNSKPEKSKT